MSKLLENYSGVAPSNSTSNLEVQQESNGSNLHYGHQGNYPFRVSVSIFSILYHAISAQPFKNLL